MAFSNYMTDKLGDFFFFGDNPIPPFKFNTPYLGMTTGKLYPGEDPWVEPTTGGYARQAMTVTVNSDGYFHLKSGYPVVFTAGANWGEVIGVVVFDEATLGNVIFDVPWIIGSGDDPWEIIHSYNITSGCICTITAGGLLAGVRTKPTALGYVEENGGISVQFSNEMIKWVFTDRSDETMGYTFPYPRTYDVALGSGIHPYDQGTEGYGRFNGNWSECGGGGYDRISVPSDIWEWQSEHYSITNNEEIFFTESALDSWGRIEDVVLFAHGTEIPAFWAHLETSMLVSTGDYFSIGPGKLRIFFVGEEAGQDRY